MGDQLIPPLQGILVEPRSRPYWLMSSGKAFTRSAAYQDSLLGTYLEGEKASSLQQPSLSSHPHTSSSHPLT